MEEGQARFEPFFSVARDFGHDSSVVDLTGCSVLRKRGDLSELSPSADFLFYSVSKDGHIQCWDSSSKDCVFEYYTSTAISGGLGDPVQCLTATAEVSGMGFLFTGTKGGLLQCFDTLSGELKATYRPAEDALMAPRIITDVQCLEVSDGVLVTGQRDAGSSEEAHTVRLWDREEGNCLKVLEGHSAKITCTQVVKSFGVNQTTLLSSSHDRTVKLWDTRVPTPCVMTMSGHRNQACEVLHDNGVVYSTSIPNKQHKARHAAGNSTYGNAREVKKLNELGSVQTVNGDFRRPGRLPRRSNSGRIAVHRQRTSLEQAVASRTLNLRRKNDHPLSPVFQRARRDQSLGYRSSSELLMVHDLRTGLNIRELNLMDVNNSKMNKSFHESVGYISSSKLLYSHECGTRSLLICGRERLECGAHHIFNVSIDTGEVYHELHLSNDTKPSTISCTASDNAISVNVGFEDGGLSFWKYRPKLKSFSSSSALPGILDGTNDQFEQRIANLSLRGTPTTETTLEFTEQLKAVEEEAREWKERAIGKNHDVHPASSAPELTADILKQMRMSRVWPDDSIIFTAVRICITCNDLSKALEILSDQRKIGKPASHETVIFMLDSIETQDSGDVEQGEGNPVVVFGRKLLKEMKFSGSIPSGEVIGALASMFARVGELNLAEITLTRMRQQGLLPEEGAYRSLLESYDRMDNPTKMKQILSLMRASRAKISPEDHTLVANAFSRTGEWRKAESEIKVLKGKQTDVRKSYDSTKFLCLSICKAQDKGLQAKDAETLNIIKRAVTRFPKGLNRFLLRALLHKECFEEAVTLVGTMENHVQDHKGSDDDDVATDFPELEDVNKMLKYLGKHGKNRPDEAFKFSIRMQNIFSIAPNETSQSLLLDACVQANNIDLAVEHFEAIKRSGVSVHVSVYNALMEVHCERSDLHRALAIVQYMEKSGTAINSQTIQILITGAFNMKRVDIVEQLLKKSKKASIDLNPYTYSLAMVTFGMAGDFESVQRIKTGLEEKGLMGNDVCLSGFIFSCVEFENNTVSASNSSSDHLIDALRAFETSLENGGHGRSFFRKSKAKGLIPPVPSSCGNLVASFCRRDEIETATSLVALMRSKSMSLPGECYGSLISAYIRNRDLDRANSIVQDLVQKALIPSSNRKHLCVDGGSSTVSAEEVKTRLRLAAKSSTGDIVAAEKHHIDTKPLLELMRSLCEGDSPQLKAAQRVLYIAVKSNFVPPQSCFHTLISAGGRAGRLQFTQEIFDRMVRLGLEPTMESWRTLMTAYKNGGEAEKMFHLIAEMKAQGYKPDDTLYQIVLSTCVKFRFMHGVRKIMREMQIQHIGISVDTYNDVISAYCTPPKNLIDDGSYVPEVGKGMEVMQQMSKHGSMPDVCTFKNLLWGAARARNLKLCSSLFDKLTATVEKDEIDLKCYEGYICGLVYCHKLEKAKDIVAMLKNSGNANLRPGAETLSLLLDGAARDNDLKLTRSVLSDLFSRGMVPTEEGYANAVFVFANCRVSNEAFKLLKRWRKESGGNYLPNEEISPYKWPGLNVTKSLFDALAHDSDDLRNSSDLAKLLERVSHLLKLSLSTCAESDTDLLSISEQMNSNRLLLKLHNSKENSLKLWAPGHEKTYASIRQMAGNLKPKK